MKLRKEQIQKLAAIILRDLKAKNMLAMRVSENKITDKIVDVISKDLLAEADLEREARRLLETYRSQINSGELDEHRVFQMIKKQLAKEKKIVL